LISEKEPVDLPWTPWPPYIVLYRFRNCRKQVKSSELKAKIIVYTKSNAQKVENRF